MSILINIEKQFKALVEDKILSLFVNMRTEDQISRKLSTSMLEQIHTKQTGEFYAPNAFLLKTSVAKSLELGNKSDFFDNLSKSLEHIGQEVGFTFSSRVVISTQTDESLKDEEIQVFASFSEDNIDETLKINIVSNKINTFNGGEERKPYIILDGNQTIALELDTINIGRRLANHIVLDDPRVSKDHAQIREINGKYNIFDLNSKGGTFINNAKISQGTLNTGDVISCAGYPLIFIDDSSTDKDDYGKTKPISSK